MDEIITMCVVLAFFSKALIIYNIILLKIPQS